VTAGVVLDDCKLVKSESTEVDGVVAIGCDVEGSTVAGRTERLLVARGNGTDGKREDSLSGVSGGERIGNGPAELALARYVQ
jgi:hypothetical protein